MKRGKVTAIIVKRGELGNRKIEKDENVKNRRIEIQRGIKIYIYNENGKRRYEISEKKQHKQRQKTDEEEKD